MEREQIERAIAALEAQRLVLGDEVVDTMLAAARDKLRALDAAHPTDDRRRQATILFADLAGFTALSERLDPELAHDLMNALWRRLDAVIVRHGGVVDKHMGDAVMALWGVQTAHEDDAERAVRAALEMVQETGDWRLEIRDSEVKMDAPISNPQSPISNLQSPPSIRVGVNTGPVLLGAVGSTGEYTALGDAVNLAQRLESAAPVGGVLISSTTYHQIRGAFEIRPRGALRVKGKAEPVEVYEVLRPLPRAFHLARRGVEGVVTRTVGRAAEMACLQAVYQSVAAEGRPRSLTMLGEAGVGKSRLLDEFEQWLTATETRVTLLKGRADEANCATPFALFRDLLFGWAGIREGDTPAEAGARLEQAVAAILGPDSLEQAHFIGRLIGLDFAASPYIVGRPDAAPLRRRASFYLAGLLRALASGGQPTRATPPVGTDDRRPTMDDGRQTSAKPPVGTDDRRQTSAKPPVGTDDRRPTTPLVLFLEDLHWADPDSLDLIEYLRREWRATLETDVDAHLPILIVAAARPTLLERRPEWGTGSGHTRLDLNPLSDEDSHDLLSEILQRVHAIPPALQHLVVATAEGNPFFMEELVKVLIEQGVIKTGEQAWTVETGRLPSLRVPPTLTALIQARLDSLHPAERDTLRRAAVAGQVFWDALVARLAGQPDVSTTLGALSQRELVVARPVSAFDGAGEYGFKHALLRDVTYDSILLRDRPPYHAAAADWLIERSGERAAEFAAIIGEHLTRAGRPIDAAGWFVRAGGQAQAVYANATAVEMYERALRLVPDDGREVGLRRADILARLGQTLVAATEWESGRARLDEARALAQAADDVLTQARCDEEIGALLASQGRFPEALARLDEARAGYARLGVTDALARVAVLVGTVYGRSGEHGLAQQWLTTGLAAARHAGDRRAEARALNGLGNVAAMSSDYTGAEYWYEQSLTLRREIYDKVGVAETLGNLGVVAARQRRFDQAASLYEESARLCLAMGDKPAAAGALNNMGLAAVRQGAFDRATTLYQESLALFRAVGAQRGVALALDNLGGALLLQRALDQAEATLRESLALREAIGDQHGLAMTLSHLGSGALLREDMDEAARLYRRALQAGQVSDHRRAMAVALAGLALVARAHGDLERGGQLAGVAQAVVAHLSGVLDPEEALVVDQAVRLFSDDQAPLIRAAWESGQTMGLDAALALADEGEN